MAEAFLSSSWYRVATLRLRLREHARPARHRYRGEAWYVLSDTLSGRAHRLSPAAYVFVGMMDGNRTVEALWTDTIGQLGEDAPSQDEVIRLLAQLHASD